jgi:hypothetical protein
MDSETYATVFFTQEETDRAINLLKKISDVTVFEYEGVMYMGSKLLAVRDFMKNNPQPADFHVWLQDNNKKIYFGVSK